MRFTNYLHFRTALERCVRKGNHIFRPQDAQFEGRFVRRFIHTREDSLRAIQSEIGSHKGTGKEDILREILFHLDYVQNIAITVSFHWRRCIRF